MEGIFMERSGKKFLWWLLGAAVLLLAAILYIRFFRAPEKELGTLVDSFEYLERAVHLL